MGMTANALYGLAPEVVDGNYDTSNAMDRSQTIIEGLSNGVSQALEAEGTHANLNDATNEAIASMKQYSPHHQWQEEESNIRQQAESYRDLADKDGNISLGSLEQMKKEQGRAAGKWDATMSSAKKSAHKSLWKGARTTIEKNTKNKDLYNAAMKEEQRLINGKKVLKKLNGKKAHKEKNMKRDLFHKSATYIALALGDKVGGPLGAVLGAMVGQHLTNAVDKRYGKSMMESPTIQKAISLMEKNNPAIAKLLKGEIQKYASEVKPQKKEEPPMTLPPIEEKKTNYKMGTYKLNKNETSGLYDVGQYRAPGQSFTKKIGRPSQKAKEERRKKAVSKLNS